MNVNPFYETIVIVSFVFIGLVFLTIGLLKKKKNVPLIIISISIFISLFLYTLIYNQNMANALSAFSTIALALFAGVALLINYQNRKDARDREERAKKERLLNEIIEWVSEIKRSVIPDDYKKIALEGKRKYEFISESLTSPMLKGELMRLRVTENAIPVVDEFDSVWHSAFYCAQLAGRMIGNRPTNQQMKNWSKAACDIILEIDKLEEQGKLSDEEIYNGQKKLLENISTCLKALIKLESNL